MAGMIKFVGKKHTTLLYDSFLYQWNMSVANNPSILGVSHSTMQSLLIGVHEFDIFGDVECNSRRYKVKLSLRKAFIHLLLGKKLFDCSSTYHILKS